MREDNIQVLLIEDDEIDIEIALRQFRSAGLEQRVAVARNGREGLSRLQDLVTNMAENIPLVVLLDLNMPLMNGQEFLEEVRNDEALRRVVIFVLSTSNDARDTSAAYEKNVAGFLLKEAVDQRSPALPELLALYFKLNVFPPKSA